MKAVGINGYGTIGKRVADAVCCPGRYERLQELQNELQTLRLKERLNWVTIFT